MKPTEKLSQNLKEVLKDIGENSVLFKIYSEIHSSKWQVFKNLINSGCDIVVVNLATNKIIKIEVKTRQSIHSTAKSKKTENQREFELTKNEHKNIDLLICYWFDYNAYFIIPKKDIKNNKTTTKIRIRKDKNGTFGLNNKYYNNWGILTNLLKSKSKKQNTIKPKAK